MVAQREMEVRRKEAGGEDKSLMGAIEEDDADDERDGDASYRARWGALVMAGLTRGYRCRCGGWREAVGLTRGNRGH